MYHLFVIVAVGSLSPMADVIATFESLCLTDVIARWLVLLPLYIQFMCLADVIAKVVDGMSTIGCSMADVIAMVADGIATGSMF